MNGGPVTWRRPHYDGAGAKAGPRRRPREEWLALKPGAHEGYIEWDRAEAIRKMINDNIPRASSRGAPRKGSALLSGIRRCRRCGRKLTVQYTGTKHDIPRYSCVRGRMDYGEPSCIAFGGLRVDDTVEAALLAVVQPTAVQAARDAEAQMAVQRDEARDALERDLEAARYAADRAFRQYDAADPENRLVAGELEARWSRALARVAEVEGRIAEHDAAVPQEPFSTVSFDALSNDLQAVWSAPGTDARLRKRIVRTVIHEVVADIDDAASEIVLTIHWMGGAHTEHRLPKRRRGQRNATPDSVVEAVRALALIAKDDVIVGLLNRNGLKTGNGNRWTRERVTALRSSYRIPVYRQAESGPEPWLNLTKAAALVGLAAKTLRLAAERGEVYAKHPLPDGPWLFRRTDLDTEAVRALVARARTGGKAPAGPDDQQRSLFPSTT